MELLKHAHCEIASRRRVERGMEPPIERSPSLRLTGSERRVEFVEEVGRSREMFRPRAGNGALQQLALDVRAQLEQLLDLLERKRRDDRAAVWAERDQSFSLELPERFTDGNAAHAQFLRERVLSKGFALRVVATQDALTERLDRHAGDRLTLDRSRRTARSRNRWRIE